jgi:hypothetical protein
MHIILQMATPRLGADDWQIDQPADGSRGLARRRISLPEPRNAANFLLKMKIPIPASACNVAFFSQNDGRSYQRAAVNTLDPLVASTILLDNDSQSRPALSSLMSPVPPPIVAQLPAFRRRNAMRPTPNRSAIADGARRRSPSRVVRMVRRNALSSVSRREEIVCSRDRPRVHSRISVGVPRVPSRFLGARLWCREPRDLQLWRPSRRAISTNAG